MENRPFKLTDMIGKINFPNRILSEFSDIRLSFGKGYPISKGISLRYILYLFVFLFISAGCKKNRVERVQGDRESGSAITIRNYQRISVNDKGEMLWKLKAEETYFFKEDNRTVLYKIEADQLEKGKSKSRMKADKGYLDRKNEILKVSGNIYIRTNDGKELTGEEMDYNIAKELLTSDKRVVIRTGKTVIRGRGFEADNSLNKFKIIHPEGVTVGTDNPFKDN